MRMACRLLVLHIGVYVTSVPLSNPQRSSVWSVLTVFAELGARTWLHRIAPGRFPAVVFNGARADGVKLQQLVDWCVSATAGGRGARSDADRGT